MLPMRPPGYIALLMLIGLLLVSTEAAAQDEPRPSAKRITRNWIEVGHGIRFGVGNTVVARSHRSPTVTYVGTDVGYIYRSLDGGVTWDEVRLLPDDVPLLNVPLMNLSALPFPNDGLQDLFTAPLESSMFRRPFGNHGAMSPMSTGRVGYPSMVTRFHSESVQNSSSSYSLGGSGARVETEDPGNLMALYFSGIAAQPGRVNWLEICPTDPTTAFAATNFGGFRTRDMGITWDRVFIGSSSGENAIRSVHCHPENENLVFLSTAEGMRFSRDGGDSWDRPTGNLGSWGSNFVTTNPRDRGQLLVGTGLGAYMTTDGEEEDTLYFDDQPAPGVRVVSVARATSDPNIFYVGTADGASYTHDGGQTWTRLSEFLLGHYPMRAIEVDPRDPRHAYILTPYHLFETFDGGESLEEIHVGYTDFSFMLLDPVDPDILWLVGYSQIWRYERPRTPPTGPVSEIARRAREGLRRDPGLDATVERALVRAHLDQEHVREHRRDIRRSALIPTLDVVGWGYYVGGHLESELQATRPSYLDYFYGLTCHLQSVSGSYCGYGGGQFDGVANHNVDLGNYGAFIVLSWPFGRAVLDERTTGRMWLDVLRMRDRVMFTIYDYWADRHQLLNVLARGGNGPLDEQAYVMRLEEMSAVLDGITDGFVGGAFGEEMRR